MDTDTFTQPRRICDRTGAHLKGCRMVKAPKGRRRALVVSRKMFETVNEVMEERDEGSLRVCYEDEERTHNISTHAHIEDTEVSIDASREWNEHDKEVIEGWKSIEVVTEYIVKCQEDGSRWLRKESETELGRPNKPYNGGGTPQGFRKKHTHRCMRRYLQERGWCQRIYLGAGRRKKKDKQRRTD